MRERAEAVARGAGGWTPPAARDASTVCLLRDSDDGVQVFVMRRTTSMAFAPGMHVYPGGAVEVSDSHVPVGGGADLAAVAVRTWSDDPRALLAAAARETFEECGVLLALDRSGAPVVVDDELEAERETLVVEGSGFHDLLARRGWVVDDGALVPFAHWVTPEVEDRRYDTRFFMASVPSTQGARHIGGEADRAAWWRPSDALTAYAAGRMAMLPPTVATLTLLADHASAASALAAAARVEVEPLMPAPYLATDGSIGWRMLHERTRETVRSTDEPAGSETDGAGGRT